MLILQNPAYKPAFFMELKGIGIITTREFVKKNFSERYDEWLQSLPSDSRMYYNSNIDSRSWYSFKDSYAYPLDQIIKLFMDNDPIRAFEIGYFSANYALNSFFKAFLLFTSPAAYMNKASKILNSYYMPSEIKVENIYESSITLRILYFPMITQSIEYRIAGWCVKSLETCGCKEVQYKIIESFACGQRSTLYEFNWK